MWKTTIRWRKPPTRNSLCAMSIARGISMCTTFDTIDDKMAKGERRSEDRLRGARFPSISKEPSQRPANACGPFHS